MTPKSDTSTARPEDLEWLQAEVAREQEHYWSRFTAFSALHGGLLVLATSDAIKRPLILSSVAIGLGLVWLYVQWASLFYVNRLKPLYHAAREARGLHYPHHPVFSRRFLSSTDIALVVPAGLTILWIVFPLLK